MSAPPVAEFQGLDFGKLLAPPVQNDREEAFRPLQERAMARVVTFEAVTPEERLEAFRTLNFRPHGLFLPDDFDAKKKILSAQLKIGEIPDARIDERLQKYFELQTWTGTLEGKMPGRWSGQMEVIKSRARFRLVAWGRRGGKTVLAANEALGVAIMRPRSWVWLTAPTMETVGRAFDMVLRLIDDLGYATTTRRDSTQEKLVVLAHNNSRIEGVSLDKGSLNPGAVIDFAVVDEATYIGPDAFEKVVLPPLTDHTGHVLMISSYDGQDNYFYEKVEQEKAEAKQAGTESEWEVFEGNTYDTNFFVAPQGINTPAIKTARRNMDPHAFLEQYGAIPSGSQNRVYPEFKEKVHCGRFPYNPDQPVILAVDPSGGSNPYAIIAIQDYGDRVYVVDEVYEEHSTFEELNPLIQDKPWASEVTDVVVDSALPAEIERWVNAGWPAFPVFEKPKIEDRLPIVRSWLREPSRYYLFYRARINFFLAQQGKEPDTDHLLSPDDQRVLMTFVEESLNNDRMADLDIQSLRGCARLFINESCTNTIKEFKMYRKNPRAKFNLNLREQPRKSHDHAMDALGYFHWHFKRFEITGEDPTNFIQRVPPSALPRYAPTEAPLPGTPEAEAYNQPRRITWLSAIREMHRPPSMLEPQSFLEVS